MSNNGRNGHFLVSPHEDQRQTGVNADSVAIPNFVPVVASGSPDAVGRQNYVIAKNSGSEIAPKQGLSGLAVYEGDPWNEYAGTDPMLTRQSDIDKAPVGDVFTVQSGAPIKVRLTNTGVKTWGSRSYPGRTMVAGLGATPTVAVGDFLTPGVGDDASGYWAETSTAGNAWLRVTFVDPSGSFLDAVSL